MNLQSAADCLNLLASFLGPRDIPELTQDALEAFTGQKQADAAVLFGGSILAGGDVFAQAMRNRIARKFLIVGGEGHTTQNLRDTVHRLYPSISTEGLPEAQVFSAYLSSVYGLVPDALECASTNCGNNITYLLDLMCKRGFACSSMVLIQDASMQCRMGAGLKKASPSTKIIHYASYQPKFVVIRDKLSLSGSVLGIWTPERMIELLMGEIPRLQDNSEGYGPKGRNFIAHVDIPADVLNAFKQLSNVFSVRSANPLYASDRDLQSSST